ncbi:MAG TPA: helix-turn-helix domain-containing protein [Verrucomicrobiae bacterium]|jgi:cytoskeletal protein RodZ
MPTVAEQLRAAREARKLSIQQVAEITKLKGDQVRALEAGDYDAFAAPVYIRGFIRTYGALLKLDVPALLKAVDEELAAEGKFQERSLNRLPPKGPLDHVMLLLSRLNWRVVLPVLGVALLLIIAIYSYRGWRERRAKDPLSGINPGLYQPRNTGETVHLPTTPPPKK